MTRPVTTKGKNVIKSFEGRALKAYRCPAGVWTIGYGNTNYDKFAVSYLGRQIGPGMTITAEQAEYLLDQSLLRNYCPAVEKAMPGASDPAYDAGTSFHYNTGAIGRASWVAQWRAKASYGASLLSWNKAKGRVLAGLDRRRKRELAMLKTGDYGPEGMGRAMNLDKPGKRVMPGLLKLGDNAPEVAEWRTKLLALGLPAGAGGNKFDADMDFAVRQFQGMHKQLQVDGRIGPATRAAIQREHDAVSKLKTGSTVTGTPNVGVVAADQGQAFLTDGHTWVPLWVYGLLAAMFIGTVVYYGWQYRDELLAKFARKFGKGDEPPATDGGEDGPKPRRTRRRRTGKRVPARKGS